MKISLCSDLHLDVSGYQELPGGEVLILAGDIAELRNISNAFHSTKIKSDQPVKEYACSEFFKYECDKYDRVFYVMGNHEHYRGIFNDTTKNMLRYLPDNVHVLENNVVDYNGVMFMGATLWTDLNRRDPLTSYHLKQGMSDYHHIKYRESRDYYRKLRPGDTADEHSHTLSYFSKVLELNKDRRFVIITHHAPSHRSIHEYYRDDTLMNGGYVSELDEWIMDRPQIAAWCHGHVHNRFDYMIDGCRVMCNSRGYLPYEGDSGFDVNFTFEV